MATTATANSPECRATWQQVFGSDTVPVISPVPRLCNLPGRGETPCYMLDMLAISDDARQRLVEYICGRFGLTPDQVQADIDHMGVPIPIDSVTVSCNDIGLLMSLVDEGPL